MASRIGNVLNSYLWIYGLPPKNLIEGWLFLIIAVLYWLLGLALR
jgi:hypothetical protein